MFSWFRNDTIPAWKPSLQTDVHSHLLPGIDDGVKTLEESVELLQAMQQLGFERFITSPHVHEMYRNTTATIQQKLQELQSYLKSKNLAISVSAIAEYSLDEWLMQRVEEQMEFLTFLNNHLLFETNFFSEPLVLNDFIFKISTRGYRPVLAHPERYMYLFQNKARINDLLERGVLFQLNTISLAGAYGPEAEKLAKYLIDLRAVHMLGSDCHSIHHVQMLAQAQKTKYYAKATSLPLLNYSL